jgi:hypothetical protein
LIRKTIARHCHWIPPVARFSRCERSAPALRCWSRTEVAPAGIRMS